MHVYSVVYTAHAGDASRGLTSVIKRESPITDDLDLRVLAEDLRKASVIMAIDVGDNRPREYPAERITINNLSYLGNH